MGLTRQGEAASHPAACHLEPSMDLAVEIDGEMLSIGGLQDEKANPDRP